MDLTRAGPYQGEERRRAQADFEGEDRRKPAIEMPFEEAVHRLDARQAEADPPEHDGLRAERT